MSTRRRITAGGARKLLRGLPFVTVVDIQFAYHSDLVVYWSDPVFAFQLCRDRGGRAVCTEEFRQHPQAGRMACPCDPTAKA